MHAYLIIGKDKELIAEKAQQFASIHKADVVPYHLQKINDVRDIESMTKLSVQTPTAFFIEDIDNATPDALNAFLKQLEEPGKNIFYILTARSEDKVLPTILSRCQIVRVMNRRTADLGNGKTERLRNKETEGVDFIAASLGTQLQIIDKIKKREEAIGFVQDLIERLHKGLISQAQTFDPYTLTTCLEEAQRTLTALEKNGNVTIQLTRMIVRFKSEKH
jgi:DNA polymerase III delta prime subunit